RGAVRHRSARRIERPLPGAAERRAGARAVGTRSDRHRLRRARRRGGLLEQYRLPAAALGIAVQSRHMSQLFQRKPIAALMSETDSASGLKRTLGAGDLIMLAIGAVIGAGIFGAIGTAAAGQVGPNGEVIRTGAGPALVF